MNSDSDIDDELEDRDEQRDYIRSVERAINVGQRGFANIGGQIITKLGCFYILYIEGIYIFIQVYNIYQPLREYFHKLHILQPFKARSRSLWT